MKSMPMSAAGLVDVLAHGVAVDDAGPRRGRQHHAVVVADGGVRAQTGHHRLGAAAEPGEVVVLDVAGADPQVGVEVGREDLESRAAAGRADRHAARGVQVDQADAARGHLGPHELLALLGSVRAVAAEREEDADVLRRQRRELLEQRRQEAVRRARPGDVTDDDRGRARRGRQLGEPRRADGLRQGAPDLRLLVLRRRRRRRRLLFAQAAAGADDGDLQVVGQVGLEGAVPVRDRDLHSAASHRQPKRTADSLSASITGIGLPERNCTMAPPAVHT